MTTDLVSEALTAPPGPCDWRLLVDTIATGRAKSLCGDQDKHRNLEYDRKPIGNQAVIKLLLHKDR